MSDVINNTMSGKSDRIIRYARYPLDPPLVLGVDPTFNLGKFNLTVTTYSNLKVVDRVTRGHPTMMGPLLLSQKKTFDSYNHFSPRL